MVERESIELREDSDDVELIEARRVCSKGGLASLLGSVSDYMEG